MGLHRPSDQDVPDDHAGRLGALIERHVDLDKLLKVAETAAVPEPAQPLSPRPSDGDKVLIAVAKDAAFCFYYAEYALSQILAFCWL